MLAASTQARHQLRSSPTLLKGHCIKLSPQTTFCQKAPCPASAAVRLLSSATILRVHNGLFLEKPSLIPSHLVCLLFCAHGKHPTVRLHRATRCVSELNSGYFIEDQWSCQMQKRTHPIGLKPPRPPRHDLSIPGHLDPFLDLSFGLVSPSFF